ncbi:MAG: START domain-containing protein [Chlorobiaceae bacterium]|jgi:START domain
MDTAQLLHGDWKFRIEHKGIKIFSSQVSGSDIYGFKGETEMEVSLKKLISLLYDMKSYNRWVHQLVDMHILDNTDPLDYVVRQILKTPWPLQEREVIMRTGFVSAGGNSLAVTMKGEPDYLPDNPQYHRVRHASGIWHFTPTAQEKVHITFVMHIDPGKDVPSSVSNTGMFEVPFYTLNNLRNLLKDSSYAPPYPEELARYLSIVEDIPDKP